MNFDWLNWDAIVGIATAVTAILLVRQNAISKQGQKMGAPRPTFYQANSRECSAHLPSGTDQWGIVRVHSHWLGPRFNESAAVKHNPAGGSIMGARGKRRRKMDFGLPEAKVQFFACQGRWPRRRFYIRVANHSVPGIYRDFPFDVIH